MTDLPPDLPEHVVAFLAVAGSPPRAWSTLTAQEARAQHIAFSTKDIQEGIGSFLERRDPEFRGF